MFRADAFKATRGSNMALGGFEELGPRGQRRALTLRLLLLGLPGSGSGTQASLLASALSVPAVFFGDTIRTSIARGTASGLAIKKRMDAGEIVLEELTLAVISERLLQLDCQRGFVLQGFPQSVGQAVGLDERLAERTMVLDHTVLLRIDQEVLFERFAERAKSDTSKSFHEPTVRAKLQWHADRLSHLCDYYAKKDRLRPVDAKESTDVVSSRILAAVGAV